jgi:hypothetical protein
VDLPLLAERLQRDRRRSTAKVNDPGGESLVDKVKDAIS